VKLHFKDFLAKCDQLDTPIYYLTGPEEFLKFRAKERLFKRNTFKDFTKTKLTASELNPQTLWGHLCEPGLFAKGEVIVFNGIDAISASLKKSFLETIVAWEEQENTGKILIFISDEAKVDPADPLEGHFLANSGVTHVFFPYLTITEVTALMKGELKRRKKSVPEDCYEKMATVYGNDFYQWNNFVEQLDLYLGDKVSAGPEDIDALLAIASGQENIIYNAIEKAILTSLQGNPSGQTLKELVLNLEKLLQNTSESLQFTSLQILRYLGDMTYEIGLAKSGVSSYRRMYESPRQVIAKTCAQKFNWDHVSELCEIALGGERQIKTGALPPEIAAQEALKKVWEFAHSVA